MNKTSVARLLAWVLVMGLPLWLGSCKKDGTEAVTPSSIEGNWKLTAMKVNPAINAGPFGQIDDLFAFYSGLGADACLKALTFTFNSNGTISSNNPTACQSNTDDINEATGFESGAKWSLNGNKLTVTDTDGAVETYDVTISGNAMQWVYVTSVEDATGKTVQTTLTMGWTRA